MQYRREIDGLRAVAVIPVVLFHAGFDVFSGGYAGVDVFFVISGYLITGILIGELERGDLSIVRFYERRARRILPALFLVLLLCAPLAWILMVPSQLNDFGQGLIAVSLFASNILFWRESGYFAPSAEENPLLHTWSLAVEEQYYMLFPLFLLLTWRLGRRRVFHLIAAVAVVSLVLSEWGAREAAVANFYLAPSRAWELLAGSLCAFALSARGQQRNEVLAALGLGLIVLTIFAFDASTPFPSLYALAPVGGTVLIILFAAKDTWTARLLSLGPLVGIGLISYSLYLWHQPLFAFARIASVEAPPQLLMLGLAALALGLSYLTWRYVEAPFRRRQRRLLPRTATLLNASAIALLLFVAAGAASTATDGFRAFKSTDRQRLLMRTATQSPKRDGCHIEGPDFRDPDDACEYFAGHVTFAVFGDSHSVELAYALASMLRRNGVGVRQLSFSACLPSDADREEESGCAGWTDAAIDGIVSDKDIKNVVVSYRINSYLFGDHADTYPDLPAEGSETERRILWDSYVHILQRLAESGKRVVLVLQAPELPQVMEGLIYDPMLAGESIPGLSRQWWSRRNAYVREHLRDLPPGVTVINPADEFCDKLFCYAAREDVAYYFDDDHLSIAGARVVAADVLSKLGFQEPLHASANPRPDAAASLAHSPGVTQIR